MDELNVTKHDGIMLFYNFAVVFTAGYAVSNIGIHDRWSLFAWSLLIALVWTIYFKIGMIHRFTDHPALRTDDDEDQDQDTAIGDRFQRSG